MERCILWDLTIGSGKSRLMDRVSCEHSVHIATYVERRTEINQLFLRPASASTASQPKSIAVAGDSTVFIAEIGKIEAFRSNQRVFEQKPSFEPSAVAASGSLVAIGEVCIHTPSYFAVGCGSNFGLGPESPPPRMGRQSSKRNCCPRRQPRSRIVSRLLARWKIPCLRRRKCLSFIRFSFISLFIYFWPLSRLANSFYSTLKSESWLPLAGLTIVHASTPSPGPPTRHTVPLALSIPMSISGAWRS